MTIHRPTPLRGEKRQQALRAKGARRLPLRRDLTSPLESAGSPPQPSHHQVLRMMAAAGMLACGIWSYWPTVAGLATTWWRVNDYWHGFLVIPLAAYFLLVRRDSYPGLKSASPLLSLAFFSFSLALRHTGDALYFTFMDGWSILPWTAALVAILGGRPLLRWAWPSIVFLLFLIPLPFSLENEFSGPLQRIATTMSTATLQFLGQPAFAEGNVILIGSHRLEVAQACSGLRMFVGILALTYAYVVIIQRPWWEKVLVVLAAVPVAIISNIARIVGTGFLYQWTTNEQIRGWMHDFAGIGMFLFAGVLFWLLLLYLRVLVREEEVMDMSAVVRQCRV